MRTAIASALRSHPQCGLHVPVATHALSLYQACAGPRVRVSGQTQQTVVMELVGPSDLTFIVEPGVLDERARLAFGTGQCHGLAIALHRRFGWQLVAVDDATGSCVHVCVRRSDGRLIDANGAHAPDDFAAGTTYRDINEALVDDLVEHEDWAVPEVEKAAAWVDAIIDQASESASFRPPRRTAVMRLTRTHGDFEVCFTWDGDRAYQVFVRRTEPAGGEWVRYSSVGIQRDAASGRYVIDFTPEALDARADRYLRLQFDPAKAEAKIGDV